MTTKLTEEQKKLLKEYDRLRGSYPGFDPFSSNEEINAFHEQCNALDERINEIKKELGL